MWLASFFVCGNLLCHTPGALLGTGGGVDMVSRKDEVRGRKALLLHAATGIL